MAKLATDELPEVVAEDITPDMLEWFESPGGVSYSLEVVNPATAEVWLTHNTHNRIMREADVDRYARDMHEGKWRENGDSVAFDVNGVLLNGQHRLAAIVRSEVTLIMLVVRGLPSDAQDTMDDGRKRTMAETFGFHGVANGPVVASVTRRVIMWEGGSRMNSGNLQPTKQEQLDAFQRLDVQAAVQAAVNYKSVLAPQSVIGLTFWLFYTLDPEEAYQFWIDLSSGSGLEEDDPVYVLREKLIRAALLPGRKRESEVLYGIIKAWNLRRAGRTVSKRYGGYTFRPGTTKIPDPQ